VVWREHHIALFLSTYREGLPRTIIEAAAAGRPIIACAIRDAATHFVTGKRAS